MSGDARKKEKSFAGCRASPRSRGLFPPAPHLAPLRARHCSSPAATPPQGLGWGGIHAAAGGKEVGTRIPFKWKNKDHWGKFCVYSAPLARLSAARDPADGLGGKRNVSGGSVLAAFSLWPTSGTEPGAGEEALAIPLTSPLGDVTAFAGREIAADRILLRSWERGTYAIQDG